MIAVGDRVRCDGVPGIRGTVIRTRVDESGVPWALVEWDTGAVEPYDIVHLTRV